MNIRDDSGASAVEYGLLVFAIAAVIVTVVVALGVVTRENYQDVCDQLEASSSTHTC